MNYQVALITGASSGIGRAIAEALAREGLRLILVARRRERLEALRQQLSSTTDCHVVACDVNDRDTLQRQLDALPEAFAAVDVLVNNAGLALGLAKAHEADWDDWQTMIQTNCLALAFLTRHLLPGMVERRRGHIVNLGSIAGSYPYPGGNIYGATKAFVEQLTLNLKADLLGTPVRVTNIEPGMVSGESEFSLVRFKGNEEAADRVRRGVRALDPADIAESVVWVLSRPAHVNVNRMELMSINQAPGGPAYHRMQDTRDRD